MVGTFVLLLVLGALWLAVSYKARWKERSRAAETMNKKTRQAHEIKTRIVRDDAERQRVRDHFDSG